MVTVNQLTLCLVSSGTTLLLNLRSSNGWTSSLARQKSSNSGWLCKTCGFTWKLCLLEVTLQSNCHR